MLLVERYAGAGVCDRDGEMTVPRARGDAHCTGVRKLDCVAYKIEQHLRQPLFITQANWKRLVHGCRKRELLVLRERLGGRAHRLDHALYRVFGHVEGELAGFDLGDVEHRIDETQQVLAVGTDTGERIERFRSLRLVEAFLDEFGIPENGRKRGSELVAHVGHELVLVLAGDLEIFDGFGKLASACLDFLEESGVLDGDRGLVGEARNELDFFVAKGSGLPSEKRERTKRYVLTHQWHP